MLTPARRHRLADERRAIRIRRTVNPRPSLDEIRAAWARVRATVPRGGFGDGTLVALEAAVALRIDPDCVPREADSAGSESSSSVRVMRCLGGERPLRVAGRVRAWISRWRGRTEAEGASSVEAAVAGA